MKQKIQTSIKDLKDLTPAQADAIKQNAKQRILVTPSSAKEQRK